MRKNLAPIVTMLLCSIAISFGAANYLLNNKILYAIALIALYFSGGLWSGPGKIGTKMHAVWVGIGIGFLAAVLFFLPSAFAM